MYRSVSEPSLDTRRSVSRSAITPEHYSRLESKAGKQRGKFLFEGRWRKYTMAVVMTVWNTWFQTLVLIAVLYEYITHLLIAYYFEGNWLTLDLSMVMCEVVFAFDVFVHILHSCWPMVRQNVRVYRRNCLCLIYDVVSLMPGIWIFQNMDTYEAYAIIFRWLAIGRVYRVSVFFYEINGHMQKTRMTLFYLEQGVIASLILHASTCLWYYTQHTSENGQWSDLGQNYPPKVNTMGLKFDSYRTCFYYCTCRFFNCVFGDSFPVRDSQKWLTSFLMIVGYVVFRFRFVGAMAWEMVRERSRKANYIDQYRHMIEYLKISGASSSLVEQCKNYKQQLWMMKDGVLRSRQLKKVPLSLQMELLFDINVEHFHNSLLFRNTKESFMRQISLLMRHELFLAGQHIWSQEVVKSGMICIKRGVIEMLSDEDDESPMIAFKEGTVLGELSLFYSIPAKVTVKAATYVELQVLRRTDFMRAVGEHPVTLELIRNTIKNRLSSARSRQDAIVEYDKGDSRLIRTRYRPIKVLKDNLAGVEPEDPTFVDDSYMYYRDKNNVRLPKFTPEYLELYKLSANVTTIASPRICLRPTFPWILIPDTDFSSCPFEHIQVPNSKEDLHYLCRNTTSRSSTSVDMFLFVPSVKLLCQYTQIFDAVHFVIVLCICFMCPYGAIQNQNSDLSTVLTTIMLCGLLLNIFLQLTTAVVHKKVRKETVKEIAEVKMASIGFYLDVLSVFPMYIFTGTMDPQRETILGQIVELLPILQIWHIWDYFNKWAAHFDSHERVIQLMKFLIIFIICSYWSGCFLYLFACPLKLCRENSWMMRLIYWETKVFMSAAARHETPIKTSFSFGTAVFTGVGSSEMAPGDIDLYVVVFIFILGVYLCCYYTSQISCNYYLSTQRRIKFKESMRELFYFLSVNCVSSKIKARVKKFFLVQWYYNSAVSTKDLFADMSTNMQQEVLSVEMMDTLQLCPLFRDCNRDFLQTVASNTRKVVLPDNEVVQHAADIGRYMYIVKRGHCNVLLQSGKKLKTIGPGCRFGVMEMLFGLPKVYTVVTATNCILLHIEYSALVQCWGTFPNISYPIIKTLADHDVKAKAAVYEEARPLIGKLDVKTNRIAQEFKESFTFFYNLTDRQQYVKTFNDLGILRHLRYVFIPGSITPHGAFLKAWCAMRFLLAVFYILFIPYEIALKQHRHGGGFVWPDILLYLDIIVMSYVSYYNEKSLLVSHPLLTTTRYLKHTFVWDLLCVFPFESFVKLVNDSTDLDVYRINRMLLLTRIMGAFTYWESNILRVNPIVVLVKFIPIAVTIINLATALVFTNTCKPYLPIESSHILVNCTKVLLIGDNKYQTTYAIPEYIYTFYWVCEIFVGMGCTPVGMYKNVDLWIMMVLKLTGFLFFAFMFGYVASTRSAAAHSLLDHNEKTKDLENFLYQQNVHPLLTAKTLKYFEYVWKRTNGSNPQKICRRLNSALMEDTLVFMYERALREVPLFGKVERSFIRVITQHLHEIYMLKGDTVIQSRDVQPYIFIIYRGKVDVLSSYNEMITCMGPGGMFGNFTGQPVSCSEVTIYASRSLDLLVIPSVTFFNLIKYYPKIQEPLNKAFERSRDYILPITMENNDNSLESSIDSELNNFDGDLMSESSKYEMGNISMSNSQSDLSQTTSASTIHSLYDVSNFLKPGSLLYQYFGYCTCAMVTLHFVIGLYDVVTLNDCFVLFWMHGFLDMYFYLKIYFNMHQGYASRHGYLTTSGSRCRRRYFKSHLLVWTDILANFPLELFGFCFTNQVRAMHYLRVNKFLRLKYLVQFYNDTSRELTNNLTSLQVVMTLIAMIIMTHTAACFWLVGMVWSSPICNIRNLKIHMIDEERQLHNWDYSTSFYIIVSQVTSTGGDEYFIDEILPILIIGVVLLCGKMMAGVIVAVSIQLAYSTKYALTQYETGTKELISMLSNQGLSSYQMERFWKYIKQLWVTERGRQLPSLLAQTPYVRRCDLMSAMFGHHLRNCYIFADTGEAFLRQLTVVLDYTTFFPGNYIVVAGDSEARMYWVASGKVAVVSVRSDLTEVTHEYLGPGNVFGILQGMHRGTAHSFSYRAETQVGILSLSLDNWIDLLSFFPEAKKIVQERSEILFTQI